MLLRARQCSADAYEAEVGIHGGAAARMDLEVDVRRAATRVARVADVGDRLTRADTGAGRYREAAHVRVVVLVAVVAEQVHGQTSEAARALPRDASGHDRHRR